MSRTRKGSKPVGYEYWGKRPGSYWVDRKTCHRKERMEGKDEVRNNLKNEEKHNADVL
ncbi:hypothetical protein SHAb15599_00141 [Acinetobacter phage SH-Ab 15599]|nr:hypothetical protein SHAb15599_00141 [Acinetobacter phage SH-Ab 15599]